MSAYIPERELWQTVIFKAFIDATNPAPANPEDAREKVAAHRWIATNCKDFRRACMFAGMDPHFLSDAYRAGRVDPVLLRAGEAKHGRNRGGWE
jgi:hypothetical protein